MALFTRSLWPVTVRAPYLRLAVAFLVSPFLVTALLTLLAFVLAEMSEQTTDGVIADTVIAATIDSGVTFGLLVAMFAASFGLVGVALLWSLSQRGILAWMTTGVLFGAVAGSLFSALVMKDLAPALVVISTLSGLVFFVLVRLIAGIQDDSRRD